MHAEYILTHWIKTSEDFFKKNIPLTLFERVVCVRGSWRPNRTATYWPPLLWPLALCLSCSPVLLNRRPGGSAFCWVQAFSTTYCRQRVSKLTGGPESSFCRVVAFSTASCLQLTDFLSSPCYIIVQSPAQSLEWHVWSSSSGNNCHAVHRTLSSGVSVYECTMGFYLVSFFQPSPPTLFLLITAFGMCHFLPVHHFGMACLAGSKANIQQQRCSQCILQSQLTGLGVFRAQFMSRLNDAVLERIFNQSQHRFSIFQSISKIWFKVTFRVFHLLDWLPHPA